MGWGVQTIFRNLLHVEARESPQRGPSSARRQQRPEAPTLPARPGERRTRHRAPRLLSHCTRTGISAAARSDHTRMLLVPRPSEAVPRHTHAIAITLEGLVGEGSPSAASSLITS